MIGVVADAAAGSESEASPDRFSRLHTITNAKERVRLPQALVEVSPAAQTIRGRSDP
jgi:hypothetical protein